MKSTNLKSPKLQPKSKTNFSRNSTPETTSVTPTNSSTNNSVLLSNTKYNKLQKQPLSPPTPTVPQKLPKVKKQKN